MSRLFGHCPGCMLQISLPQALTATKRSDPLHRQGSKMAWRQLISFNKTALSSTPSHLVPWFASFSSKSTPYIVKVGIPEFLNGVGKGVEAHVEKLESEIGDIQKLLVARTLKLKKLGIPCKHRKLILKYAHKYRVGLWRPQALPVKS